MLRKVKKDKNIRSIFTLGYIISIGCAVGITCIVLIILFNGSIGKNIYIKEIQNTRVFSEFIDLKIKEINRIAYAIVKDLELRSELEKDTEINGKKIQDRLKNIIVENREIDSICLIDKNDNVYIEQSAPLTYANKSEFIKHVPYESISNKAGSAYMYISQKYYDEEDTEETIALGREILSNYNYESIGSIVIYIKKSVLNNMYISISEYIDSDYILCDENNKILYFTSSDNKIDTDKDYNIELNEDSYSKIEIGDKVKNAVIDDMNILSGKIISVSNKSNSSEHILIILIIIVVLNVVFLLLYNLFIERKILKPLDKIADGAKSINTKRDLSKRFITTKSYTEVDYIVEALNNMMDRVQNLIAEVEKKQKIQNKLQLDRLNGQIKPHFLYNTLNIASSLITIKQEKEANEIIYTLARYYRESLSGGNEIITLGEEISITYDYVKIIKLGQRVDFDIRYDIDNDLISYNIPKLTIQPLIENCIKYAIKDDESKLNIIIKIKKNNNEDCIITIIDDGKGIDKNTLNKISKKEKIKGINGFGLRSVIERISLYYEVEDIWSIVKITSKENEGTSITIVLPNKKCIM